MTFGEALKILQQRQADNIAIKPSTRHYWNQIFVALLKSWPGLADREVKRITRTDCNEWARGFRKTASPSRYNNTIAGLRPVFEVAVEAGVVYGNPAVRLERLPIRQKQLTLPSREQFLQLVETVEDAGGCSRDCADLLRGLAFTGCRKGQAAQIEWRDVDFDAGEIIVRGDAETGTNNDPGCTHPLSKNAQRAPYRTARAKVFRVNEAQKAIDSAARKLEMARIVHHDLRHLFATICIENGVDIPSLALARPKRTAAVRAWRHTAICATSTALLNRRK